MYRWCGLCHWDTHSENKLSILWLFAIKMFAWSRASTSTPAIVIIPSINSNLFIGWMRILFRSANTWYTFASPKMPFIHSNLVAKAFRTLHLKSKNQNFSLLWKWKFIRLAKGSWHFFSRILNLRSRFFSTKIAVCLDLLKITTVTANLLKESQFFRHS